MLPSDDIYIMVEDELHDIANLFTRSLHRAEYQRLQALAASKNASNISAIQRPANNSSLVNKETLVKLERIVRAREQEKLLQGVPRINDEESLSSDEEEKERVCQWQGTNLGALMLSPGRKERDLSTMWRSTAATRAARGFHKGNNELLGKHRTTTLKIKGDDDIDENTTFGQPRKYDKPKRGVKPVQHHNNKQKQHVRIKGIATTPDSAEDDGDDGDLDAPILKFNLNATVPRQPHGPSASNSMRRNHEHLPLTDQAKLNASTSLRTTSTTNPSRPPAKDQSPSISVDLSVFDTFLPRPALKSDILGGGGYKGKAMAALAKKRQTEGAN